MKIQAAQIKKSGSGDLNKNLMIKFNPLPEIKEYNLINLCASAALREASFHQPVRARQLLFTFKILDGFIQGVSAQIGAVHFFFG